MKRYIIIFCSFLVFSSCTKFGKTDTAKGRVYNPITGVGIPDVTIKLLKSTSGLPGGDKAVKETQTDSNGSFEISKAGLKVYRLACNYPTDYYPIGWFKDGEKLNTAAGNLGLKKGKTLNADFYAVPYGQLHWNIKNINCEGITDTMWYKIKYQYDEDFLDLWSFPFVGCVDIVGNGSDKMIMGNHILYLKIKRQSGITYLYDTIYVSETGVTSFNLNY